MAEITTLNLCSGYDGLGLALDIATGGRTRAVCHVEIEVPAALVLAHAMESGALPEAPIWSDLRTFDALPWRGVVDIVVAGYPCQPFSVAGKRGGDSDPRHLWPEVARIVEECQPAFGFFENVSGHLVLGFDRVAEDLERLGYRVAAGVFTASEVGASHQRERLFILAHRNGNEPSADIGQPDTGTDEWHDAQRCGSRMGNPCECGQCGKSRRRTGQEPENGYCRCLAHAKATKRRRNGYADDSWRGIEEDRGSVPLFPPGPSDPQWGRIIERWPDLAPAVESSLCRVVDGRPARARADKGIDNETEQRKKTSEPNNTSDPVQPMRRDELPTREAPSRLQQAVGCRDSMREVPPGCGQGAEDIRGLACSLDCPEELRDLRRELFASAKQARYAMWFARMQVALWNLVRDEKVGESREYEVLRSVWARVSGDEATHDGLWAFLREQASMDEAERDLIGRVDQLRMLGNGVLPLAAAHAFCALSAVLGFGERW